MKVTRCATDAQDVKILIPLCPLKDTLQEMLEKSLLFLFSLANHHHGQGYTNGVILYINNLIVLMNSGYLPWIDRVFAHDV
jgi:hypothetical protein